eukprot:3795324-Ditylum_brightwellii.AAC.1
MPRELNGCLTLSFEIVHGVWPDLCILFRLFATEYFTHTQDATRERITMESHLLQDESGHTATSFNLHYNSGMFIGLYSLDKKSSSSPPELYPSGTEVSFLRLDGVRIQGSVISVPIGDPLKKSHPSSHLSYSICLVYGKIEQVSPSTMAAITRNNKDHPTIQSSQLVLPQWIGDSKKVTSKIDSQQHIGRLILENGHWTFKSFTSRSTIALPNFALTYKSLLEQQLILPG